MNYPTQEERRLAEETQELLDYTDLQAHIDAVCYQRRGMGRFGIVLANQHVFLGAELHLPEWVELRLSHCRILVADMAIVVRAPPNVHVESCTFIQR